VSHAKRPREIFRAGIFHTPGNPFQDAKALETFADGALLIEEGRIAACGEYGVVAAQYPMVPVHDLRGGFLLPGFIDTHIHFPQVKVLGGLGRQLLDWLEFVALPEEARMADVAYAADTARRFVRAMAANGTTTALVFGAHFADATAALFETAEQTGLRVACGMVLSDRMLRPELHQSPEAAYRESTELIRRFHGKGRGLYAVTPRFALSASEAILEVCRALMTENPGVRFTSHLNENKLEIAEVARLFPWASDYMAVYERFGLCGPGAVMAHNVHPTQGELERMAAQQTWVSHCPCSNGAIGSGIFPMARHLAAGVPFAMGTDVGGGTGFGMIKEGLQAYTMQRIGPEAMQLTPGQLLYLATRAGAEALRLEDVTGDFAVGKSADFTYLKPPAGGLLEGVVERAGSMESILAGIFTVAGVESIAQVRVEGTVVHQLAQEGSPA
jgi:guanine deaminase